MKRNLSDRLFSLYIRTRGAFTCQRCRTQHVRTSPGLHCAHVFSRGNKTIRWDPSNALVLCRGCHAFADQNKETVLYPLYQKLYGEEAFDLLRLRANTPGKPDEIGAVLWLRKELKRMGAI